MADIDPQAIVNNLSAMARQLPQPAEVHEAMTAQTQALQEWIASAKAEIDRLKHEDA